MTRTGRIVIDNVSPVSPHGYPAKALVGDAIDLAATVFRDGHGLLAVRARCALAQPAATKATGLVAALTAGYNDRFTGSVTLDRPGLHHLFVDAWTRRYATWRRDVERWMEAGEDVTGELEPGAAILEDLSASLAEPSRRRVADAVATMRSDVCSLRVRLDAAFDDALVEIVDAVVDPTDHTVSGPWPIRVERRRAGLGAWYEFFPRSEGGFGLPPDRATNAADRLDAIAAMGFDVVYLPPIHPIGMTKRKGVDGSTWAIGSPAGGHDALEPSLGTLDDFATFVERAGSLGLEIALDYALQCSPDHPWVAEHPEWFRRRPDGSIRYAENPPKRYEDIVPLEFWPASEGDRIALWEACRDVLRVWIDRGVAIFRVDNPHTKPIAFWEWVIPQIWATNPEVVFLSEAFTHPAMMHRLAEVGFSQSYTYFAWRHDAYEVRSYLEELAHGPDSAYFRPNLWPNTPDILAGVLRGGNRAAFQLRALLAALGSPSYGIYSGYELCENIPASEVSEDYADSEKFRARRRDWSDPVSLAPFLARLNQIRRSFPGSFERLDNIWFHHSEDDRVLVFQKGRIVVVVNFDTASVVETTVHGSFGSAAAEAGGPFVVRDLLDGTTYTWHGSANYVRLDPSERVAHVLLIEPGSDGTDLPDDEAGR